MPVTAQAFAAGAIGADHVDLLTRAAGEGRHRLFARDEAVLVAQCEELTYGQAVKAIQYWCRRPNAEVDHDGTPPPKPSTLGLHTGFDGTVSATSGWTHRWGHRQRSVTPDRTRPVPPTSATGDPHHE